MAALDGSGQKPAPGGGKGISFRILSQFVKDLSFENPYAPKLLATGSERPNMRVDVRVGATPIGDNTYEVTLTLDADASHSAGKYYQLEVAYGGVIRVENVPEQALQPFLLIQGPTFLFPYLRRLVADVTREGGFPPLMLDPIDFVALYAQNAARINQQAQAQSAPN